MSVDNITWWRTGADSWALARAHRGYDASISYTSGVGYTLSITGPGAPADAAYSTLRMAKNAFRKFLFTKPVT